MAKLLAIVVIVAGLFLASEIHEKGFLGAVAPWAKTDATAPAEPLARPAAPAERSRPSARDVLLEAGPVARRGFESSDGNRSARRGGPTSFKGYAETKGDALQRRADSYER